MEEKFSKPDFGKAPNGYIAGLGRGATGFVTKAEIAPGMQEDHADYNDSKFDSWEGYSTPLFKN